MVSSHSTNLFFFSPFLCLIADGLIGTWYVTVKLSKANRLRTAAMARSSSNALSAGSSGTMSSLVFTPVQGQSHHPSPLLLHHTNNTPLANRSGVSRPIHESPTSGRCKLWLVLKHGTERWWISFARLKTDCTLDQLSLSLSFYVIINQTFTIKCYRSLECRAEPALGKQSFLIKSNLQTMFKRSFG